MLKTIQCLLQLLSSFLLISLKTMLWLIFVKLFINVFWDYAIIDFCAIEVSYTKIIFYAIVDSLENSFSHLIAIAHTIFNALATITRIKVICIALVTIFKAIVFKLLLSCSNNIL